jgi:hypothetical protein
MTPIFDAPFFRIQFPLDFIIAELDNGNDVVTVGNPFAWMRMATQRSHWSSSRTTFSPLASQMTG